MAHLAGWNLEVGKKAKKFHLASMRRFVHFPPSLSLFTLCTDGLGIRLDALSDVERCFVVNS